MYATRHLLLIEVNCGNLFIHIMLHFCFRRTLDAPDPDLFLKSHRLRGRGYNINFLLPLFDSDVLQVMIFNFSRSDLISKLDILDEFSVEKLAHLFKSIGSSLGSYYYTILLYNRFLEEAPEKGFEKAMTSFSEDYTDQSSVTKRLLRLVERVKEEASNSDWRGIAGLTLPKSRDLIAQIEDFAKKNY